MKLFKKTQWNWWELKLAFIYPILIGLFVGTVFSEQLADLSWYILGGAIIAGLYVTAAYIQK